MQQIASIPRSLLPRIERALQFSRVVALIGARQAGKSTIAKWLSNSGRECLSLDVLGTLDSASLDPEGFIQRLKGPSTIDEVQRVPRLLLPIKVAVDNDPTPGRFLLTGSADILTLPKIADSLAGRMQLLELYPLAQSEIERSETNAVDRLFSSDPNWKSVSATPEDLATRMIRGGYPRALQLPDGPDRKDWFENYVQTMLQRDIVEIAKIEDVSGMHRLLQIVGARTGRILNVTALGGDIGMKSRTAQRYLELLEQTFLMFRIPAWTFERGRRYIHAPKMHISDTGLAASLANLDVPTLIADRTLFGNLFESFVTIELRKLASWSEARPQLFHYRLRDGSEIDLILETSNGKRIGMEIKSTVTIGRSELGHFLKLVNDLSLDAGVLLYTGDTVIPVGKNVTAVPVANLWTSL